MFVFIVLKYIRIMYIVPNWYNVTYLVYPQKEDTKSKRYAAGNCIHAHNRPSSVDWCKCVLLNYWWETSSYSSSSSSSGTARRVGRCCRFSCHFWFGIDHTGRIDCNLSAIFDSNQFPPCGSETGFAILLWSQRCTGFVQQQPKKQRHSVYSYRHVGELAPGEKCGPSISWGIGDLFLNK